jgi:hypothetical protein
MVVIGKMNPSVRNPVDEYGVVRDNRGPNRFRRHAMVDSLTRLPVTPIRPERNLLLFQTDDHDSRVDAKKRLQLPLRL